MSDNYLEKGIAAAKQGNKPLAIDFLKKTLASDPKNSQAWLWLASVLDDPQKQIECLKRVLRIQPDHQMAKNAIKQLQQKIDTSPVVENSPVSKSEPLEQKIVRSPIKGASAKSLPMARPQLGVSHQALLAVGLLIFGFLGLFGLGALVYVFRENLFPSLSVTSGVGGDGPAISRDVPTPIDATPVVLQDARTTIKNNNFESVELLGTFQRDAGILSFSVAQAEKLIAVSYEDGFVHALDIKKGVPIWEHQWNYPLYDVPLSRDLALDPSGSRLTVNNMIIDIKSDTIVPREGLFARGNHALFFSPKSDFLISYGLNSKDEIFQVWKTSNGNFSHSVKGNSEYVRAAAFSPDGSFFIYQDDQASFHFVDPYSGNEVFMFASESFIDELIVSPDNKYLAGYGKAAVQGSYEDALYAVDVWNIPEQKFLWKLTSPSPFHYLKFSGAGKFLDARNFFDERFLWRLADGKLIAHTPLGQFHPAVAHDGTSYVQAENDNSRFVVFDGVTDLSLNTLENYSAIWPNDYHVSTSYVYSVDNQSIYFAGASDDGMFNIMKVDLKSGELIAQSEPLETSDRFFIEVSPDGKYLVYVGHYEISIFDGGTLKTLVGKADIKGPSDYDEFLDLVVTQDSSKAVLYYAKGIIVWDLLNQNILYRGGGWDRPEIRIYGSDFTYYVDPIYNPEQGEARDFEIMAWALKDPKDKILNWMEVPNATPIGQAFDKNGEQISSVIASYAVEYGVADVSNGTFFSRKWNIPKNIYATRAELQEIPVLSTYSFFTPVFSLSPDQTLLASWNGVDTIIIQRVSDGETIQRIFTNGTIETLGFSQQGELIGFTDSDRHLAVYEVSTASEIISLPDFGWSVKSIAFSKDLKLIALAGADLTIISSDNPSNDFLYVEIDPDHIMDHVEFAWDDTAIIASSDNTDEGILYILGIP